MRAQEAHFFTNISATTAAFGMDGGSYRLIATATFGGGNVGFEQLGPDGVTWLSVITALTANGQSGTTFLPPGQFRVTVTTATAVYAVIGRVPGD